MLLNGNARLHPRRLPGHRPDRQYLRRRRRRQLSAQPQSVRSTPPTASPSAIPTTTTSSSTATSSWSASRRGCERCGRIAGASPCCASVTMPLTGRPAPGPAAAGRRHGLRRRSGMIAAERDELGWRRAASPRRLRGMRRRLRPPPAPVPHRRSPARAPAELVATHLSTGLGRPGQAHRVPARGPVGRVRPRRRRQLRHAADRRDPGLRPDHPRAGAAHPGEAAGRLSGRPAGRRSRS